MNVGHTVKVDNRFYLDHNAHSPLALSVMNWLTGGDLLFGNPSARHLSGQKATALLSKSTDYLKKLLDPQDTFHLVYHSGATEGLNGLFQAWRLRLAENGGSKAGTFHCLNSDHSIAYSMAQGNFDRHSSGMIHSGHQQMLKALNSSSELNIPDFVYWCWAHSETGSLNSLNQLDRIKERHPQSFICVDGAQVFGRFQMGMIPEKLDPQLDAYTFSGHKFGSLAGIGFSLIHKRHTPHAWSFGGLQNPWRSGTLNAMGAYSMYLALSELEEKFSAQKMYAIQDHFLDYFKTQFPSVVDLPSQILDRTQRALNSLFLYFPGIPNDRLLMALSLAGVDVSAGSACASGSSRPNRVALAMGLDEEGAKQVLRFSWDYRLSAEDLPAIFSIITPILKKLQPS